MASDAGSPAQEKPVAGQGPHGGAVKIVDLRWERARLEIDLAVPGAVDPVFMLRRAAEASDADAERWPIDAVAGDGEVFRLTIDVANFRNRAPVPDGEWVVSVGETGSGIAAAGRIVQLDLKRGADFDAWSRAFVFDGGRGSYTVTFDVADSEEEPDLLISTHAFAAGGAAGGGLAGAARATWARAKRFALRGVFRVARATKAKGAERVLFVSDARPSLQGNLKAVHDRMIERGLNRRLQFDSFFRTARTTSRASAFQLGWKLGRADIVLTDDYLPVIADLSDPAQKIIQLWHAGVGFKLVGYSSFGRRDSPGIDDAHRHYTFAICGSEALRDVYSEVFGIEREAVIPTGLPRVDAFLREGREAEVRAEFEAAVPASRGKRRILFAPTFRGTGAEGAHYDYDTFDFEALAAACGDDTVVLFRQHHLVTDPAPIPPHLRDRLIDVTDFPDTNDLLLISDVLITDYSSIIYEYALLGRPMVFYAYDLDEYSLLRGLHRNYRETAPGEVAETFERLLELIASPGLSTEKTEAFVAENFSHVDTSNSDRVIDQLILADPRDGRAGAERAQRGRS